VFVPGKPFQSSLLFAGKAGVYPSEAKSFITLTPEVGLLSNTKENHSPEQGPGPGLGDEVVSPVPDRPVDQLQDLPPGGVLVTRS
jgi:hypothetical protein